MAERHGTRWRALALACALAALPCAARADQPSTSAPTADAVVEARLHALAAELRCLVCQNQSLADSHAALAEDLRDRMRAMLRSGASDEAVLAFLTERYGDFVLYRPPLRGATLALWFGPAALLVLGLAGLALLLRRRNRMADERFDPEPDDAAPQPST